MGYLDGVHVVPLTAARPWAREGHCGRCSPASGQPSQVPFRCGDHGDAAASRGLIARTVPDRHLILSRLVDMTDAARVGLGVS